MGFTTVVVFFAGSRTNCFLFGIVSGGHHYPYVRDDVKRVYYSCQNEERCETTDRVDVYYACGVLGFGYNCRKGKVHNI